MSWQITIAEGEPELFGDIGCSKLKREVRSQAAGTFSFTEKAGQMDMPALANNLDPCKVLWVPPEGEPVVYFQGRISSIPRLGAPGNEERRYVISDAWLDFERITYQQQWNLITGADEEGVTTVAAQYRSECLLGIDLYGNALTSDLVIVDAVNWAISRGAAVQLGTILRNTGGGSTASPVPIKEVNDLPCSEVIKEMLKLTPDAVTWLDYSTTPPTFNVARRADCTVAPAAFSGVFEDIELSPRYDLVRSEVLLRYVREDKTDGVPSTAIIIDAAPDGADGLAYDALVSTVRLAGGDATYQKQAVQATPVPATGTEDGAAAWWQSNCPAIAKLTASRLSIVADTTSGFVNPDQSSANDDYDIADYPRQLVGGTLAPWMDVKSAQCTWYVAMTYHFPDIPDEESAYAAQLFDKSDPGGSVLSVTITGTSASTKTYAQLSSYDQPEPAPVGFAATLYGALSVLHYEGSYSMARGEIDPTSRLGIVLNITGSLQPWDTMNALVQEIVDDLDEGRTTWKVGPPGHLSVQDLMAQLNYTRHRETGRHINERTTGRPGDTPEVDGPALSAGPPNSNPPVNLFTGYPFVDYVDVLDDEDGDGETWSALVGYGKDDSIAGPDAIDHSGPLESFELSVGNDGSAWLDPSGDAIDAQDSLANALNISSGNQTATDDQILIGVDGDNSGSVAIYPAGSTMHFSINMNPDDDQDTDKTLDIAIDDIEMDDGDGGSFEIQVNLLTIKDSDESYIHLDLTNAPEIDLYDDDTGANSTLDSNSLTLDNGGEGGTVTIDAGDIDGQDASFQSAGTDGDGNTIYVLATGPIPAGISPPSDTAQTWIWVWNQNASAGSWFAPPPVDGNMYVLTINDNVLAWTPTSTCPS